MVLLQKSSWFYHEISFELTIHVCIYYLKQPALFFPKINKTTKTKIEFYLQTELFRSHMNYIKAVCCVTEFHINTGSEVETPIIFFSNIIFL